jgi:hypothetical protein
VTARKVDPLAAASVKLGLDLSNPLRSFVEEVVDGGDEPPEYVFVGKAGRGRVTAKQLTEFRYCDAQITQATGEVVDNIRPAEWRQVRRLLLAAKTVETLGAEAGVTGTTRARLLAELREHGTWLAPLDGKSRPWDEQKRPIPEREWIEQGLDHGYPVILDGRVWFSVEAMLDRLDRTKVRYVRRDIMRGLLALGCKEKRTEGYTTGLGNRTRRTLYAVPQAVVEEFRDEAREKS